MPGTTNFGFSDYTKAFHKKSHFPNYIYDVINLVLFRAPEREIQSVMVVTVRPLELIYLKIKITNRTIKKLSKF